MRITFVTYTYPHPKRGFNPGIERVIESLSQELARKGHDVHVITTYSRNDGKKGEENVNGVKIHRVKDVRDIFGRVGSIFSLDLLSINYSVKKCNDILQDSDILHVFTPFLLNIPNVPVVSHFHHPEKIRNFKEYLYLPTSNYLWRKTYERSDAVISVSKYSARYLIKIGISPNKIFVVPNGVDTEKFHPNVDASGLKNRFSGNNILLYVGPITQRKGLIYLIKSMPKILAEHKDTILVLVGKGNQEENLKRLSNKLGISRNVIFEGFIPEDQLPMYYNACDLFVFPSLQEGFGMVLAEAMSCGKTVVASNTTAIPEVVGDAGVLVEPKNPDALAEAIIELLSDEQRRKILEQKALTRARNFTWDESAINCLRVYRTLSESNLRISKVKRGFE